ncbi:SMODS domain-containing nucleotidyltransferase [Pseudazoarcus pumilus]|uniref:Nucleotidyltransferase n=1 Tax=Pseudazoarcus pumilus TaxID=2067960 RepID=A0A2I6S9F2_9RHOO|nr:nucleotidyltransferase [Pseudazoarcus pumilus]AUN95861.1 nucleotidyltransferase [Pseudazoarcus pumilus]
MKLHDHFKVFLSDQVNLNSTRITQLESSVGAIKTAVRSCGWGVHVMGFGEQGSWAHATIIKPLPDKEFDADLLVFVSPKEGWSARDYINKLANGLEAMGAYQGKIRRYSHCVTVEYAGERRIDIAPCVRDRTYEGQYEVCNRTTDSFELSAPIAYTDWVKSKNGIAGGNDLKKVTRLLKYLRDIKGNFTCPSFLFTTLVGNQIQEYDRESKDFADLTTSLKTLVGRLDDWLQANPYVPHVPNPKLPSENQSAGWTETQYANFRDKINLYRGWIDDAFNEPDRQESIAKWQRVFGAKFGESEARQSARVSAPIANKGFGASITDLVERLKTYGAAALMADLSRLPKLPYVQRPKWRPASSQVTVKLSATLHSGENSPEIRKTVSLEPLQPGYWLKFTPLSGVGLPFTSEYTVHWRVTNTDEAAYNAKQLRGDYYAGNRGASRIEELRFRGIHFVEAFVVRNSDNRLVGKSEPFYVVIQ